MSHIWWSEIEISVSVLKVALRRKGETKRGKNWMLVLGGPMNPERGFTTLGGTSNMGAGFPSEGEPNASQASVSPLSKSFTPFTF